jgi:membrane-associated phospholipid phosphatase
MEPPRRPAALLAAAAAIALAAAPAAADPQTRRHVIHHAELDAAGAALYLIAEVGLKPSLAPSACRWCQPPGFDASVRDALVWGSPHGADVASSVLGFGVVPAAGLGLVLGSAWHRGEGPLTIADDGVTIAEAAIITGLVNEATKFAVGRQRPFVHYATAPRTAGHDDNVSFYSGHTALAFAVATASGTVASRRGYKLAPVVWGVGLTLAGTTGYLRIAADKHYLSDVVVGAVLGSAAGVFLPRWLHDHRGREIAVVPTPGGIAVLGQF